MVGSFDCVCGAPRTPQDAGLSSTQILPEDQAKHWRGDRDWLPGSLA